MANVAGRGREEFLSRCDQDGRAFYETLFERLGRDCPDARFKWNRGGVSIQFPFAGIGHVGSVWGFTATTSKGKDRPQRLRIAFDKMEKKGAPRAYLTDFHAEIGGVKLRNGDKRRGIDVDHLSPSERNYVIDVICKFARRASGLETPENGS